MDIYFWLTSSIAFICGIASGLTGFGDAILFHVLFALSIAAGLLPLSSEATIRAVGFVTVISLSVMPQLIWSSRRELLRVFPYSVVMGLSGLPMVPVGTVLLLTGDLSILRSIVGALFLAFSGLRLVMSIRDLSLSHRKDISELQSNGGTSLSGEGIPVKGAFGWDTRACVANESETSSTLHGQQEAPIVETEPIQIQPESDGMPLSTTLVACPETASASNTCRLEGASNESNGCSRANQSQPEVDTSDLCHPPVGSNGVQAVALSTSSHTPDFELTKRLQDASTEPPPFIVGTWTLKPISPSYSARSTLFRMFLTGEQERAEYWI